MSRDQFSQVPFSSIKSCSTSSQKIINLHVSSEATYISCNHFLMQGIVKCEEIFADKNIQLMLVYTGMAADILEIFEAFRENKVNSDGGDDDGW